MTAIEAIGAVVSTVPGVWGLAYGIRNMRIGHWGIKAAVRDAEGDPHPFAGAPDCALEHYSTTAPCAPDDSLQELALREIKRSRWALVA